MKRMDKFVMYEILYFLPNDSLMKLLATNKEINEYLIDATFKNKIIHRKHPVVFNICDNFCRKCNFFDIKKYHIYFNPLVGTERCHHY